MAFYTTSVHVTGTTAGAASGAFSALQFLMPASRACRLVSVTLQHENIAGNQDPGIWVVDEINAVSVGSALTPLKLDNRSRASEITDITKTFSATCVANNTAAQIRVATLVEGVNIFDKEHGRPELISALNQGYCIRRQVAPSGDLSTHIQCVWEEL